MVVGAMPDTSTNPWTKSQESEFVLCLKTELDDYLAHSRKLHATWVLIAESLTVLCAERLNEVGCPMVSLSKQAIKHKKCRSEGEDPLLPLIF